MRNRHRNAKLRSGLAGNERKIEIDPGKPLQFRIREVSWELPGIPGFLPRPDHFMTQPNRVLERCYLLPSNHTYSICIQIS